MKKYLFLALIPLLLWRCRDEKGGELQVTPIESPVEKKEINIPKINRQLPLPATYKLVAEDLIQYLDQRKLPGNSKILILAFMQKYQDQGLNPSFLIDTLDIHQQLIAFAIDSTSRTSERIVASAISSGIKEAQTGFTNELHEEFRSLERRIYKSSFSASDTSNVNIAKPIQIYTVFDSLGGFVLFQRGNKHQNLEEFLLVD